MKWLKLAKNEYVDRVELNADFLCLFRGYSKPDYVAMFRDDKANIYIWPSSSEIAQLMQHKYSFLPCLSPDIAGINLVVGESNVFDLIA